jgi:N-acyl-D-aspartate/D-glutamate deacylase
LRTSALTAIDLVHQREVWKTFLGLAKFLNSWLMQGKFHFQVLSAPFQLWCEGPINPVFEEFATTRPLLECPLEDREGRRAILANPDYITKFERDWSDTNIISTFQRNLGIMFVDSSPVPEWTGEHMGEIFARVKRYNAGDTSAARSDAEATACKLAADSLRSDPVFFLHLLREYDRDIRFHFTVGNDRPEILEQLLFDENTLPGFNDSGAHLINMAFFDGNLMTLKIAQKRDLARVALAVVVHRIPMSASLVPMVMRV